MKTLKHFIADEWVQSQSAKNRQIINPFDQSVIAEANEGDASDVASAIESARSAFDDGPWPHLPASERATYLHKFSAIIKTHAEELAQLETLNTGKTLEESRWDMADVAGVFSYFANCAEESSDQILKSPNPDTTSRLVREPVGVCAQICPWNYPLLQAVWKISPALAAGCTIIVKPSELTPLTTVRLFELCEQLNLPPGTMNLVMGTGKDVGTPLTESPLVDMISFTGGLQTGKAIMHAASKNVTRVTLELGGKNPHIVFEDADLDLAVDCALNGVFFHAGQICSAGTRLIVHQNIHDAFVDKLAAHMKAIRLGNGLDDSTEMGPLISKAQRDKVAAYVEDAKQSDAQLVCGGSAPTEPALANGFFYLPTLFTNCTSTMPIVQEEVFGPVITVEQFTQEDEAVALANHTPYGLSAGFWTKDTNRIERVSRRLRFGTIWNNDFNIYFTDAPWGGFKRSGFGRELGQVGFEEYTEIKHIYCNQKPSALNWFGKTAS